MLSGHAGMACKANKATVGTPPGKKSHQMNLPLSGQINWQCFSLWHFCGAPPPWPLTG